MKTIGLSPLEIRGIVERAFLPLSCTCEQGADDRFTIRIEDLHSGRVCLVEEDVSADRFASSREISDLIAELRTRLAPPTLSATLPAHPGLHKHRSLM